MNYLFTDQLAKAYGDQQLFSNVSIGINKGQKIGLIARNGTGKTTLLKILAGLDQPDSGTVEINPKIKIGFLEQETILGDHLTVKECLFATNNPVVKLIQEYELCLLRQQKEDTPKNREKLEALMEQMEVMKAWDYEFRIKEVLGRLLLTNLDQPVSQLSGGQKKRISLASVLIQEPDFLILDEPTNHLDIGMIEWLEQFLSTKNSSLLIVTHDRYFLDKVTEEIIEIDQGISYKYKGNYAYYLEKKAERIANTQANVENAQKLMRKELEWMRRSPKARGTKAKSRIDSFYKIEDAANAKRDDKSVSFDIKTQYIGNKILEFIKVNKKFGDTPILKDFNYKFQRYDRVGMVGNNGTGKTTFLNMLMGLEKYDSGKISVGETVQFGYFKQDNAALNDGKRIIDTVRDVAEFITLNKGAKLTAVQLLIRFMFPPDTHFKYVSTLSGGERRRLQLLTVLMKNPNFLILDEPTNDLDLDTLNVMEDFLTEFKGCLIVVTHDRYFMDRMVDHLFVFEGNGMVRDFPGNYSQYRLEKSKEEKQEKEKRDKEKEAQPKKQKVKTDKPKTKLSYKEKQEFEGLEKEIEELEKEKAELEERFSSGTPSNEDVMKWSSRLAEVVGAIETKSDRWLELSEYA